MTFKLDLLTLYYVATKRRLQTDYLNELVEVMCWMFQGLKRPVTPEAYEQYLRGSVAALVDFSKKISPHCLEQPEFQCQFTTVQTMREFIVKAERDEWDFREGQREAFVALAKPFIDLKPLYKRYRTTPIFKHLIIVPEPSSTYDGTESLDAYNDKVERYNKAFYKAQSQAYADITPIQSATLNSPIFECAARLLPNSPLGLPFNIPEKIRYEGMYILASTGRGKTNLLRHLILKNLEDDACVIIIDPKLELTQSFRYLKTVKDKLVVLEPDKEHPLAINPLDMGNVSLLMYLFSLLAIDMTDLQRTILRSALLIVGKMDCPNLSDLRDIFNVTKPEQLAKYQAAISQLEPEDQEFFKRNYCDKTYNDRKGDLLWRLRAITHDNEFMRAMFRAKKTRLNMGKLMDEGKLILINNDYRDEKLGTTGAEFFARLFIALIWSAARGRTAKTVKRAVYVYFDEAHYSIRRDTTISEMIEQLRAQNVALTFAHQKLSQIDDKKVLNSLLDCAVRMVNVDDEAPDLAPRMRTTAEALRGLQRGEFAAYVREPPAVAVLAVPPVAVNADQTLNPRMTDAEHQQVMERVWRDYCIEPNQAPEPEPEPEPEPAPPKAEPGKKVW